MTKPEDDFAGTRVEDLTPAQLERFLELADKPLFAPHAPTCAAKSDPPVPEDAGVCTCGVVQILSPPKKPMKRIAKEWESFRVATIHPAAGEAQLEYTRDAFYAGAQSMFTTLSAVISDNNREPTDDDLNAVQEVSDELSEFIRDFKRRQSL